MTLFGEIIDSLRFLSTPPDSSLLYVGVYDPTWVALSILVAVLASYTALDIVGRIETAESPLERRLWLASGALALGGGIWAMHFIGMIAFSLPCTVSFDPRITLVSMLPGILASGLALWLISRPSTGRGGLWLGAIPLGAGIGAMHYAGMAAYRLDGLVRYHPGLFAASILVAVGLAWLALWVKPAAGRLAWLPGRWATLIAALVMGGAVSGMHYTAMAAAYFISDGRPDIPDSLLSPGVLASAVSIVSAMLLALVLAGTVVSRHSRLARQLQASERHIRRILESTQEGFWLVDRHQVTLDVNPAMCRMLGRRRDEILGHRLEDFLDTENQGLFHAEIARRRRGESTSYELELRLPDGSRLPCLFNGTPILDEAGELAGSFALVNDISRRRAHEIYVRQAVAMFENTAEGIMLTDAQGNMQSVNPAFTRVTGYSEAEVLGHNPRMLQSGRHDAAFYHRLWAEVASTGHWQGEIWNRRKNGEVFPQWLTISTVPDSQGRPRNYVGVFSDISHIKRSEAELERLAHYDPLTELANRTLLAAQMAHALERAKRQRTALAVLVLDLDGFKTVNDSLGHPAGDRLLQIIAGRLKGTLRAEDVIARLGGDEFAVVLETLQHPEDAGDIAKKIIRAVAAPMQLDGHGTMVGASIGIALYPDDGQDATSLLKAADTAMYASKQAGRGTYRFHDESMALAAQARLDLEQGLCRALEQGELEVWYQPQVDLDASRLVGAEALVRWRSPKRGLVPPGEFIPVAEETGLILPLGEWVLGEACRQFLAWRQAGLADGRISVNVAGPQLERGDFVAVVERTLTTTGLPAECLELEITESFLLRNAEQAMAVVDQLTRLGVSVAIDDFGTGYSSLAYLKYLRADKLKIDRGFVRDLPGDRDDAAITRAVIALGHNLGFTVIAEGVETAEQGLYLRDEGCDQAQGYYYSRPLPATEFEDWLRRRPAVSE